MKGEVQSNEQHNTWRNDGAERGADPDDESARAREASAARENYIVCQNRACGQTLRIPCGPAGIRGNKRLSDTYDFVYSIYLMGVSLSVCPTDMPLSIYPSDRYICLSIR